MRSSSSLAFENRGLNALKLFGQFSALVIERKHVLFLRLLLAAQMFQLFAENGNGAL